MGTNTGYFKAQLARAKRLLINVPQIAPVCSSLTEIAWGMQFSARRGAAIPATDAQGRSWPLADIQFDAINIRFRG